MEQLFVILLLAAFGGMKWLMNSANRNMGPPPPERAARPARKTAEQDQMKTLMEALGLPAALSKAMPPLVPPGKFQAPPSRSRPAPAPRPKPAEFFPPASIPAVPARAPETRSPSSLAPLAAPADSYAQKTVLEITADPAATIRALLKSPESTRSAIVLREILGPPGGLQI